MTSPSETDRLRNTLNRDSIPKEIFEIITSLKEGIVLPAEIWNFYFEAADPRRISFHKPSGEISALDFTGGKSLLVYAVDGVLNDVHLGIGNYERGINIPWSDFVDKYPKLGFVEYINGLPMRLNEDNGRPIGFSYRQWREGGRTSRASITYAGRTKPAFEPLPFFEYKI